MEGWAEVGPGNREPDDTNGQEDEVVEDAARFPKAGGGGEEFPETGGLLGRQNCSGHRRPPGEDGRKEYFADCVLSSTLLRRVGAVSFFPAVVK
jgi:hypothetical protein